MTTIASEHLQQRCSSLGGLDSVQASGQLRQIQLDRIQLERTFQAPVNWAEHQLRLFSLEASAPQLAELKRLQLKIKFGAVCDGTAEAAYRHAAQAHKANSCHADTERACLCHTGVTAALDRSTCHDMIILLLIYTKILITLVHA